MFCEGFGDPNSLRMCLRVASRLSVLRGAKSIVDKKIVHRGDPAGTDTASLPDGCRNFLVGYSEYRDGHLASEDRSFFVGHMARCSSCRRYDRVIRRGVQVLREPVAASAMSSLSTAEVRFRATAFERESLALGTAGSGVTLSAAVVVALLLAAVAWSPYFSGTPEVEMPPVVAGAPATTVAPAIAPLERLSPPGVGQSDLWDSVRSIFFEAGARSAQESEADPDPH